MQMPGGGRVGRCAEKAAVQRGTAHGPGDAVAQAGTGCRWRMAGKKRGWPGLAGHRTLCHRPKQKGVPRSSQLQGQGIHGHL